MPGLTNLVRRGATYYYRGRVPRDLVDHYRRREFFVSLKTSDRQQAEHALAHLSIQISAFCAAKDRFRASGLMTAIARTQPRMMRFEYPDGQQN
ncbi:DUF6538 domain-containing protein [uncultured Propionivibrio sp.]|uniref:DUF6538 domain-containing protein n=1 Tax=uncultured Propionivibrio sp. TaxID=426737 RepID=UPI0029C0F68F|nr:DUF6538 domain-containing protein [uncultured Propionivibrio sp.]